MARPESSRAILIVLLLLLGLGPVLRSPPASADPDFTDLGNGNRTVTWDFANLARYTLNSTETRPDGLTLQRLRSSWTQTSDTDFATNGRADPELASVGGSLRLGGNEGNLVANGDFSGSGDWTFANSASGSIAAARGLGSGDFTHSAPNNSSQFDSMDTGNAWQPVSFGIGATSIISSESLIVKEGAGSLKDTISLDSPTKWTGIQTPPSAWNFQPYNEFSVWLNGTTPDLFVILNLRTASTEWNSDPASVPTAWELVRFNISSFGADLGSIIQVQLRFTGTVVLLGDIYIDDLWRRYFKSINERAWISQGFSKSTSNSGQAGSAVLRWDTQILDAENVLETRLALDLTHEAGATTAWSMTLPGASAWTTRSVDVSAAMASTGAYTASFSLSLRIETHLATAATVRIDNIVLSSRDYHNGTWVSNALGAGTPAIWDRVAWTAPAVPETSVRLETRTGASSTPGDATWSPWVAHTVSGGEAVGAPDNTFLQLRLSLETLNSSRSPVVDDIRTDFSKFSMAGDVTTLPYAPGGEFVKWRRFNATNNDLQPSDTGVAYEMSSDGTVWRPIDPGEDISDFPGIQIIFRANLATANTSRTPRLTSINVTYEFRGALASIRISPASWQGTPDEVVQFSATGFDAWGHSLPLIAIWETTDPRGKVIDGRYEPGAEGPWIVLALSADRRVIGQANVTVLPRPPPSIWAQVFWPFSGIALLGAAVAVISIWERFYRYPHALEDVFVIARDGRLVVHKTRRLRADRDEDIFAGMLTAITAFVRDSFKEERRELDHFGFGDRTVYVERGEFGCVAAIYSGAPPPWVRNGLAAFVADLDRAHGDMIQSWSGDGDEVSGIRSMTEAFVERRRYAPPSRQIRTPKAS